MCRRLAADGPQLFIGSRNPDKLKALADEIGAQSLPLDATEAVQVSAYVEAAKKHYGRLDDIVNGDLGLSEEI